MGEDNCHTYNQLQAPIQNMQGAPTSQLKKYNQPNEKIGKWLDQAYNKWPTQISKTYPIKIWKTKCHYNQSE